MKFFTKLMALSMLLYMSMFIGVAVADPGAGVCALGNGVSIGIDVDGSFTGVNVGSPVADPSGALGFGQGSATGIYSDQADYEGQCCAETGQPPDCFEPVQ